MFLLQEKKKKLGVLSLCRYELRNKTENIKYELQEIHKIPN